MVHIFGVGCTQKEAALPAIGSIVRVHAVPPLGERFDIYRVQAADKDRAAFQVKFHIIFQQYRPTQILPGRDDDTPAACRRGRIHSVLDSSCAVCPSVRHHRRKECCIPLFCSFRQELCLNCAHHNTVFIVCKLQLSQRIRALYKLHFPGWAAYNKINKSYWG